MTFKTLAKKRRSVRNYKSDPIDKPSLLTVLEAGRLAPSACNYQPWHFIVADTPDMLAKIQLTYPREWIKTAPAIIVVCGDHETAWHRPGDLKDHCDIDIAIAIDHMTLSAAEIGLGTCWICAFDAGMCKSLLALPDHIEPIALLPIGYPDEPPTERHHNRKPMEQIVHWNAF
ncbi:nitroreductase family protein [Thermoproteota archaeon]